MRSIRPFAAAFAFALAFHAAPAFAQYIPPDGGKSKMPKPEDIQKAASDLLEKSPAETVSYESLAKLTYKQIPSSADSVAKTLGEKYKDQLPKGTEIDGFIKQYGAQFQEAFNKYLTEPEGWKFEALADLKWKSSKIPKGEYKVSLEIESEQLKQIVLTQGEAGKKGAVAIKIRFSPGKKNKEDFTKLKFEFKAAEVKKDDKETFPKFDLNAEFWHATQKTAEPFKAPDADKKDDKKDEAKKDDTKKPAGG